MRSVIAVVVSILGLFVVGTLPASAVSEQQLAYEACVDSFNGDYAVQDDYKAIVAGVGDNGHTRCFWSWGAQTLSEARQRAFNNCRKQFDDCFLFADSNGNAAWSRRISDAGGSDGSREQDRANAQQNAQAFGNFLGTLAGALANH